MNKPEFTAEEIKNVQTALNQFSAFQMHNFDEILDDEKQLNQTYQDFCENLHDDWDMAEDDRAVTEAQYNALKLLADRIRPFDTESQPYELDCMPIPSWANYVFSTSGEGETYTTFLPFPINLSSDF